MVIDAPRAITALERFIELTAADRRDRAIQRLVRATEGDIAAVLRALGAEFIAGLSAVSDAFDAPGAGFPVWLPFLAEAIHKLRDRMRDAVMPGIQRSFVQGGQNQAGDFGLSLGISLNLEHPDAVSYAAAQAARQVTRIDDATREGIRRIIVAAVENGTPYNKVEKQLRDAYEFSRKRAHRIAVYELGDAYEGGKEYAMQRAIAQGLDIEKSWVNAGDAKVRPAHRENAAAGWIPAAATFPGDGVTRPPTDPGCRCSLVFRMAEEKQAPTLAGASEETAATGTGLGITDQNKQYDWTSPQSREARRNIIKTNADYDRREGALVQRRSEIQDEIKRITKQLDRGGAWTDEDDKLILLRDGLFKEGRAIEDQIAALYGARISDLRKLLYVDDPTDIEFDILESAFYDKALEYRSSAEEVRHMVSGRVLNNDYLEGHPVLVREALPGPDGRRFSSHYDPDTNTIHMRLDSGGRMFVHEVGHYLEESNPYALQRAKDFYFRRTAGEDSVLLRDLVKGSDYTAAELTKRDRFLSPYMGKTYGDYFVKRTEIISMGLEWMYADPFALAAFDPDYFDLIYELLRHAHTPLPVDWDDLG
jgi:SPP1 gp7 family putative phage head morphogenesis protein